MERHGHGNGRAALLASGRCRPPGGIATDGGRPRGPTIAFEGPSGAGKSRLVRAWGTRLGVPVVAEAFERLRPRPSLLFDGAEELATLELRLLGEEGRRFTEALRRARSGRPVLLDTGFAGPLTYAAALAHHDPSLAAVPPLLKAAALRARRRGRWGMADRVVYLDVPERIARDRARRSPRAHPAALRRRHAEVARWEREFWIDLFNGAAPERFLLLDGRRRPAALLDDLDRWLAASPPRSPGPAAATAVGGASVGEYINYRRNLT